MITMSIIGRITTDIVLREIDRNGQKQHVCTLPVAINNRRRNADGTVVEDVTYVNVSVWGVMADNAVKYLGKGRRIFVEGTPRARAFTRNNGQIDAALELRASRMEFLDGMQTQQPQAAPNYDAPVQAAATVAPEQAVDAQPVVATPVAAAAVPQQNSFNDDELPF